MGYHLTLARTAIPQTETTTAGESVEKLATPTVPVGMQNASAVNENSTAAP